MINAERVIFPVGSRLEVFTRNGLHASTVDVGFPIGSPGALWFTAALAVVGTVLCLRIPRWVESTAGEVPAALRSS